MARRRRRPVLPVRDGLGPAQVRLPPGGWPTVAAYLTERFAHDRDRLLEMLAAGEVVGDDGSPLTLESGYRAGERVSYYRDPPPESGPAIDLPVLYRDENILVVDKPHFLATTPRGGHIVRTALVQLRRELDLPELCPAHRLDRLTAGVLVLTTRAPVRGAYQTLFERREVVKTYEAVAPEIGPRPPVVVRSRIVKDRGSLQAREVPGAVNAETVVDRVEALTGEGPPGDGWARYLLRPRTGRTHQLRVHMAALGAPIMGDPLYPRVLDGAENPARPLQLLARSLELVDPVTGVRHRFVSRRTLAFLSRA